MSKALRRLAALSSLLVLLVIGLKMSQVQAATHLPNRFDELSTSVAGAMATHLLGFDITDTTTPLGSIEFQFCANDPIIGDSCTAPTGFNASGAVLSAQTGNTGFSIAAGSPNNEVILTRPASLPSGVSNTYQLDNVINPTVADTFYIRVYIFQTTDASGPDTQDGGIAEAINSVLNVNAEVPPYLKFCAGVSVANFDCSTATTFFIDMGNLSTKQPASGTSQFVVATNAQSGYDVTLGGTTLTSGNNIIKQLTSPNTSQPGVSQFGINLRLNSNPAIGADPVGPGIANVDSNYDIPDEFAFNNGDEIVMSPNASDNQKFTTSYIANVSSSQVAGIYATTLTYICLANF